MRGIKTEKIKLDDVRSTTSLAAIFKQVKDSLQRESKIPIRMVLLDRNKKQCNLLVSFIYDGKK